MIGLTGISASSSFKVLISQEIKTQGGKVICLRSQANEEKIRDLGGKTKTTMT